MAFFDAGFFETLLDLVKALDVGQGFGGGAGMLVASIGKVTPRMVPTRYGGDAFVPQSHAGVACVGIALQVTMVVAKKVQRLDFFSGLGELVEVVRGTL